MKDESQLSRCHAEIRRRLAPDAPVVILQIGAEQTAVLVDTPGRTAITRTLAIGSRITAQDHFRHLPPTPLEMEAAIAAVEEEVMPLRAIIADRVTLYTAGEETRQTAQIAGASGDRLSIEQAEALFNRIAAVSEGRPVAQENLPQDEQFYASALILREFMHHLGFVSATLCDGE